jgi:hypothetical protein
VLLTGPEKQIVTPVYGNFANISFEEWGVESADMVEITATATTNSSIVAKKWCIPFSGRRIPCVI